MVDTTGDTIGDTTDGRYHWWYHWWYHRHKKYCWRWIWGHPVVARRPLRFLFFTWRRQTAAFYSQTSSFSLAHWVSFSHTRTRSLTVDVEYEVRSVPFWFPTCPHFYPVNFVVRNWLLPTVLSLEINALVVVGSVVLLPHLTYSVTRGRERDFGIFLIQQDVVVVDVPRLSCNVCILLLHSVSWRRSPVS